MSYSRWTNSLWYTYWLAGDVDSKEDEMFDICTVKILKYSEMKDNIYGAIASVRQAIIDDKMDPEYKKKLLSDEALEELRGYMEQFISDVDEEYKKREQRGETTEDGNRIVKYVELELEFDLDTQKALVEYARSYITPEALINWAVNDILEKYVRENKNGNSND